MRPVKQVINISRVRQVRQVRLVRLVRLVRQVRTCQNYETGGKCIKYVFTKVSLSQKKKIISCKGRKFQGKLSYYTHPSLQPLNFCLFVDIRRCHLII